VQGRIDKKFIKVIILFINFVKNFMEYDLSNSSGTYSGGSSQQPSDYSQYLQSVQSQQNKQAAGSAIGGALQTGYGLYQTIKGSRLAKKAAAMDATYQIPQEIKDKLSASQLMALEGLPADQKKQYIDNLQRNAMFGLNAMGDRKAGLTGLSTLVQNQNDAARNLLSMDAQARQQNQIRLGQTQSEMAGYRDKVFDINKYRPKVDATNQANAMLGAGERNLYGGLSTMADASYQMGKDAGKALTMGF